MKRVLFVDDDPAVLDGLRQRLRRMRATWEMQFALSGPEAIVRLEQQPFDVIVTDQRMPEMDGASFLQIARSRWPRTVRIVLSGYAEPDQTVRLVPLAHQYVSKPCEPAQLEQIIERCLALHKLLEQPALRELVGRMGPLPPAPSTFAQLQCAMTSDSSSVVHIAGLVAQDTIIAAKLLQIVNSGFFRTPRRITNVEQAVAYLGLNIVRNVVVSAEVFSKWPASRTQPVLSLDKIQAHASRVAAVVMLLVPDAALANDAMLAALMHDIGYWVLNHGSPQELLEARRIAEDESLAMDEAERRVLGASHAEIGAYLLGLWGFPAPIVEAVAHHHAPTRVTQSGFDALSALCIAHALSPPCEGDAFPGLTVPHSEVTPEYLEAVQAPFGWDEAKQRVAAHFRAECH